MLFFSSDNQSAISEFKKLTFSPTTFLKSTFLILLAFLFSVGSFSQSSKIAENKELIEFCLSVNELNEGYDVALQSFEQLIEDLYSKVLNGEDEVVFPVNRVSFAIHYEGNRSNMESLERTYASKGAGIEIQEAIVDKVKLLQREKNKLDMFAKALADYINTKRYVMDQERNEMKLIQQKINSSAQKMWEFLMDERQLVSEALFEAEYETIESHDLKAILIPMNEDIKYVTQLLLESEKSMKANDVIAKIKIKRTSLADSEEKRIKDADYYLKDQEQLALYKNFYLRYQSVLTKSQNVLSEESVNLETVHTEWKLNRVSIEQLRNTYQKLKNNSLADM